MHPTIIIAVNSRASRILYSKVMNQLWSVQAKVINLVSMIKDQPSVALKVLILLLFTLSSETPFAQFFPSEGDTLNYTSVLFEFPRVEGAMTYEIKISTTNGHGNLTDNSPVNKVLLDGLNFGAGYSWQVRGITAIGEKLPWTDPLTFFVAGSDLVDDSKFRYYGKKLDRSKSERSLLLLDYGKVAINKAGKPTWYIPDTDSLLSKTRIRDLKITPTGSFTAICGESAVEFDRNGTIIWMAPDDGSVNGEEREHYHHEFTKMPNGNYLVLGLDHEQRISPDGEDTLEVEFGTVIEYSPEGKVVWSWNSSSYFSDDDLFFRKNGERYSVRTHMNACKITGTELYVGFRDISRIVVIDKVSGEITESYGGYGVFKEPHAATGYFRRQHDALPLEDGAIAILNNDSIMDPNVVSSVVVFTRMKDGGSEKLMDFKLDFDTLTNGKSPKTGNVNELPNGNLFVNLGSINRFIELTRDGELVWSMFAESYHEFHQKWIAFPQYRVSVTPSLYPYVFAGNLEMNKLEKRTRTIKAKVFNLGSESDTYTVYLLRKGKIERQSALAIPSESSRLIEFSVKKKVAYTLRIVSNSSNLVEEIDVPGFK